MGVYQKPGTKFWWMSYRDAQGARRWESTLQTDEASAREVHDSVLAAITGKTPMPERGPLTVAAFAKTWLAERYERGLESATDDDSRLKHHVLPALGFVPLADLKPRQVQEFVRALKKTKSKRTKKLLSARTVRHCFNVLDQLCTDAVADERIEHNPCVLKRGDLPGKVDADPLWRAGAVFARDEVELLISDPACPFDRRIWYALHFLTGLRPGEAAALQWRDYDARAKPLGRLTVSKAMNRKRKRTKGTKTGAHRLIPVHPSLAKLLAEWKLSGWQASMAEWCERTGRASSAPTAEDLLLPSREGRHRSNRLTLRRFHEDLDRLKLRSRRAYDSRRTFISLALAGGARKDVAQWLTHPPTKQIDEYTTLPWPTLCEAVSCLDVQVLAGELLELKRDAIRSESQDQGAEAVTGAVTAGERAKKSAGTVKASDASPLRGVRDSNLRQVDARSAARADGVRELAALRAEHGEGGIVRRAQGQTALSHCHRGGLGGRERPLAAAVRTRERP